jgi:hypothetical protein
MAQVVTFTRMMAPYRSGDVAKLPDDVAQRAITQGYATKGETPAKRTEPEDRAVRAR